MNKNILLQYPGSNFILNWYNLCRFNDKIQYRSFQEFTDGRLFLDLIKLLNPTEKNKEKFVSKNTDYCYMATEKEILIRTRIREGIDYKLSEYGDHYQTALILTILMISLYIDCNSLVCKPVDEFKHDQKKTFQNIQTAISKRYDDTRELIFYQDILNGKHVNKNKNETKPIGWSELTYREKHRKIKSKFWKAALPQVSFKKKIKNQKLKIYVEDQKSTNETTKLNNLSDVTNNSNECIVLSDGDNMDTNNQQEQRPSSLNNNKRKCSWIQPCENTKKETQREVIKEDAQSETIIKNLNKQLNHTITELDSEKKQVIKLEDNLRDEIEQKSKSQKKYKKEFTDNNQLYHKNTDLKKENTALKDELEQLKEAIKVITNENSDKSVKLIELTKSFEDSRNENVDLNLENKDLSDEKVKVITEHHNLKLENDKLQEEIPKSKIQIENTYHQTMKEFKDGHEAEFESYKIEFENFRANLNDSLIKLQKKNEQLTDKAVEDITKFEKLKLEHDILVESLNTKIKDLEDKITKQNSDISKVTTELQLSIYKSEELISKLNDKDTENKANQIKFNNLETKLIEQIDLNEKNDETLKLIKNNNGKELEALNRRFKDQHQTLLLRINEIENFKFLITDLNMKNRELEIKDIAKTEEIKKLKDICSQTQIYVAKLEEKYRVDLDKEINKKNVEINQLEQKNMHFINILTNSYQQFQAVVAPKANYDIKP